MYFETLCCKNDSAEVEVLSKSDSQRFCGAAFSHTVLMQNQLAEYHDYTAGLNGFVFLRSVELLKVEEHGFFPRW